MTDHRLEAAARAFSDHKYGPDMWGRMSDRTRGFVHHDARIILAAIDAATWQPMNTARREGAPVLLVDAAGRRVTAYWLRLTKPNPLVVAPLCGDPRGYWAHTGSSFQVFNPIAWAEIPAIPLSAVAAHSPARESASSA